MRKVQPLDRQFRAKKAHQNGESDYTLCRKGFLSAQKTEKNGESDCTLRRKGPLHVQSAAATSSVSYPKPPNKKEEPDPESQGTLRFLILKQPEFCIPAGAEVLKRWVLIQDVHHIISIIRISSIIGFISIIKLMITIIAIILILIIVGISFCHEDDHNAYCFFSMAFMTVLVILLVVVVLLTGIARSMGF